jgi:hypothetical protein
MQKLEWKSLKVRDDIINLGCSYFAIGPWLDHTYFDVLRFDKCLINLFNSLPNLGWILLMVDRRENTIFHFMLVNNINFEWICNFTTVSMNLVQS